MRSLILGPATVLGFGLAAAGPATAQLGRACGTEALNSSALEDGSGPSPARLQSIALAPRSGFETAIPLAAGTAGAYVAVQALSASGAVLETSAVEPESP